MQNTQNMHPLHQDTKDNELEDLQFMTSVDSSISQNVSMPSQPKLTQTEYNPISNNNLESASGSAPTSSSTSQTAATDAPPFGIRLLKGSGHPLTCIFHCLFKFLALFLYIFNGLIFASNKGINFITITVCCIILLAMDFWVVKNVTGRLLVGLRWWTKLAQDGTTTEWIFESAPSKISVNSVDSSIFWTVLYATPLIWGFLFFSALMRLHFGWMITVILAIIMTGSNVYGYWKCSSDQKAKFTRLMARGAEMGTMAMVKNNFFGIFNRQSQTSAQSNSAGPAIV